MPGDGEGLQKQLPSLPWDLGITPLFLPLQLKATDADEGEFGRVWYRILHGKWAATGQEGWPLPRGDDTSFWLTRADAQALYTQAGAQGGSGVPDCLHQVTYVLSKG